MKIYDPTLQPLGLILAGSKESIPPGALRRARGVHSILHNSIKSRWGSTLLHSVDAHSIYRYNDVRFQGVDTQLYRSGVSIDSGYDGTRLAFVKMKPSPDVEFGGTHTDRVNKLDDDVAALCDTTAPDYLFVAGGGKLRKVDSLGTVTNWGIIAPPDGFTASKQSPSTNGIESFEDSTSWTIVATSATLADEASIKQEGVNALKMTVAASKVGEIYKATVLNLEKFALPAVTESSLEDYITIWVRVDNPSNVENLQLIFDLDDGSFNVNTFSITIPVQSNILPQKQLVEQTIGVGSTIAISEFDFKIQKDTKGKKSGDYVPLTSSDFATLLSKTSQGYIILGQNLWTHLRIPKRSFNQTGPTSKDWGDIQGIKLIAKTNSRGGIVAYWDVAQLEGGSGMMGTYKFRVTFLNSATGSRSNPNPSATDVVVE